MRTPDADGSSKSSTSISNYAYTLGLAGNRLTVAELSGRAVAYGYDSLYRLTSETVTSDPSSHNFVNGFTYDAVGNRKQWLVNGVLSNAYTYDPDDRLGSDQYDGNGNTVLSAGVADAYDFENHLIQKGAVTLVYDGDGNRVAETVAGVTTNYLVDTQNPTGYAQVVDELQNGAVTRSYGYGLERIDETQKISSTWTPSFYGYDGHGSVRQLTNSTGVVTDTYDYDAFGDLINSTGSTPNNYLFAGEQFDPALGLYYDRARYMNTTTGRFWTMDRHEGDPRSPFSLHRYLYASADPADRIDPAGEQDFVSEVGAEAISAGLDASMSTIVFGGTGGGPVASLFESFIPGSVWQTIRSAAPDAFELGINLTANIPSSEWPLGFEFGGGMDLLISTHNGNFAQYYYPTVGVSVKSSTLSGTVQGTAGAVWGCPDSQSYTRRSITISLPYAALPSDIQATVTSQIDALTVAAASSYNRILGNLSGLGLPLLGLLNKSSVNIFFDPSGGGMVGASFGYNTSTQNATSNVSISYSYYFQTFPEGDASFE